MTKIQASIKQGEIDEGLFQTSNKVLLQMQLTVKYQAVKKEGFNSEEAAETIHKEIEEATSLEMPMFTEKHDIIISLVSLGTLLGTVAGMIKAFMH
jgi:biopolymer transport protein ExbB